MVLTLGYIAAILAGTSYAAYHDLRTSEVPDSISLGVGGLGVLYHLWQSMSAPYGLADAVLVGGSVLLGLAVAAYLRLGTAQLEQLAGQHHWGQKLLDLYHADIGPVRASDLIGTFLLVCSGAVFFTVTASAGMTPVVASFLSGLGLFALGWAMFLIGMWGGADAFVLGAVGFALPQLPVGITPVYGFQWPFPVALLFTVFFIGSIYSLIYAGYLAFREGGAVRNMVTAVRSDTAALGTLAGAYIVGITIIGVLLHIQYMIDPVRFLTNAAVFLAAILGAYILHLALKQIEDDIMTKTIDTTALAPGDVLAESIEIGTTTISDARIEGLTEEEIDTIRTERDEVTVRSGVRFIPAFPLTILVLITVGDILSAIVAVMLGA